MGLDVVFDDPGDASIVISDKVLTEVSIFSDFWFEVLGCWEISSIFFVKVIFEVLSEFSILVEYNIYWNDLL